MMVVWRGVVLGWTCVLLGLCLWKLSCCPGRRGSSGGGVAPNLTRPSASPGDSPRSVAGDARRLIDLEDFSFVGDHRVLPCNESLVALVHSAPDNKFNRDMIRATWGNKIRVFFLLGQSQVPVEAEANRHKDLIRGNFLDTYRNLTYKHAMGLRWATSKCPQAEYLVKTDDDVFVDPGSLAEWVEGAPARGVIACPVQEGSHVKRSYRSKWRVSPREYPNSFYPRYCLGWAVIYSLDAAKTLHEEAQKTPYFWIDDVHVTGVLAAKASLKQTPLGDLAVSSPDQVKDVLSGTRTSKFIFLLTSPDNFPFVPTFENQLVRTSL